MNAIVLFALLVFTTGGELLAQDSSPEAKLVAFQLDEAKLLVKFRPESPNVINLQAQISELLKRPDIRNQKYFELLEQSTLSLRRERIRAATRFFPGSLQLTILDAQIERAVTLMRDKSSLK